MTLELDRTIIKTAGRYGVKRYPTIKKRYFTDDTKMHFFFYKISFEEPFQSITLYKTQMPLRNFL